MFEVIDVLFSLPALNALLYSHSLCSDAVHSVLSLVVVCVCVKQCILRQFHKHTYMSSSYSSLDWVLSHWAHSLCLDSFVFMFVFL